jgi:hypothetical protein
LFVSAFCCHLFCFFPPPPSFTDGCANEGARAAPSPRIRTTAESCSQQVVACPGSATACLNSDVRCLCDRRGQGSNRTKHWIILHLVNGEHR